MPHRPPPGRISRPFHRQPPALGRQREVVGRTDRRRKRLPDAPHRAGDRTPAAAAERRRDSRCRVRRGTVRPADGGTRRGGRGVRLQRGIHRAVPASARRRPRRSNITAWMRETGKPCWRSARTASPRRCARWPSWTCPRSARSSPRCRGSSRPAACSCSRSCIPAFIRRRSSALPNCTKRKPAGTSCGRASRFRRICRRSPGRVKASSASPSPQWLFHRSLSALLRFGFEAGFGVDGLEEPGLPKTNASKTGVRWDDMPEIPPIMVVRMKRLGGQTEVAEGTD